MNRTRVRDILARWLVYELAERAGFRWDRSAARYRDMATGRFVSEARVLSTVEQFNEQAVAGNIERLTQRMLEKRITLAEWQQGMAAEIKDAHLVNAMAGRGGRNAMTPADWGRAGGRLKAEYQYLNQFAQDIEAGKLSEAQISARAKQYAAAGRKAYYDGKTAAGEDAGFRYEQRFLNPAEHCSDCIEYASRGRVPIGTLPEPGVDSACRSNCKCTKKYYHTFEEPE